jgi:hypothetical protein
MRLTNRIKEAGTTGYILLWLLGIPHSDFALEISAARLLIKTSNGGRLLFCLREIVAAA